MSWTREQEQWWTMFVAAMAATVQSLKYRAEVDSFFVNVKYMKNQHSSLTILFSTPCSFRIIFFFFFKVGLATISWDALAKLKENPHMHPNSPRSGMHGMHICTGPKQGRKALFHTVKGSLLKITQRFQNGKCFLVQRASSSVCHEKTLRRMWRQRNDPRRLLNSPWTFH